MRIQRLYTDYLMQTVNEVIYIEITNPSMLEYPILIISIVVGETIVSSISKCYKSML